MPALQSLHDLRELTENISASVAVFEYSQSKAYKIVVCNKRFLVMIGKASTELTHEFGAGVELPRYATGLFNESLNKVAETGEPLEFEQAFDVQKQTFWWRLSLKPLIENDCVRRIMVTAIDITEKINLEKKLKTSNSRFCSVIEAAYDGIVTIGQDQNIMLFNSAAEVIFGYQKEDIIGKPLTILMPEKHRVNHMNYVNMFSNSPLSSRDMMERSLIYARKQDGSEFPCEITISKIRVEGQPEYTAIIRDVSERTKLLHELEYAATTDTLTGLHNRRYLETATKNALKLIQRYSRPLSVLFLDLDDFKKINDKYGHDIGDDVLRLFSKTLADSFRECDTVARFGGEEFICLLPETDIDLAFDIAERFRETVESLSLTEPELIKFTVSIGLSVYQEGDDKNTLFRRCDEAVYTAKAAGKNNCKIYKK